MQKYVSIAGTMGVGKTTMVKFIADEFTFTPVLENFKHNPFLADFYKDMKRWGLHSQMFFLLEKAGQLHKIKTLCKKMIVVQDTPIYEDVYGYAQTLQKRKQISIHEWRMYHRIFKQLEKQLMPPSLIIYLRASNETLYKRIQSRDRSFESAPNRKDFLNYLTVLSEHNEAWVKKIVKKIPLAYIDIDDFDYLKNEDKKKEMKKILLSLFKQYSIV